MSAWLDDGRGGAYRALGLLALRVQATGSARRWRVSVEMAPPLVLVADLGDGSCLHPPIRVVRGREAGRTVVPVREVSGSRSRAMSMAALLARQLLDDERAALVEGNE